MSEGGLSLKVLEAYTRDVGRGVARIDYDSMDNPPSLISYLTKFFFYILRIIIVISKTLITSLKS